jgi:hypothetical protein
MSTALVINETTMQQWLHNNYSVETVQTNLLNDGLEPSIVTNYINQYKKIRYAKRQTQGFIYMGIGAFLGFLSCVCTIVNAVPALYNAILYGLTAIAITVIFVGLYFVFED